MRWVPLLEVMARKDTSTTLTLKRMATRGLQTLLTALCHLRHPIPTTESHPARPLTHLCRSSQLGTMDLQAIAMTLLDLSRKCELARHLRTEEEPCPLIRRRICRRLEGRTMQALHSEAKTMLGKQLVPTMNPPKTNILSLVLGNVVLATTINDGA